MISSADIRPLFDATKDLIADQTWNGFNRKVNVTNTTFDVTEGLGRAASESTAILISAGGFNDQKITADIKYVSPTATADSEIGVICRCDTLDGTVPNYYYARIDNDTAKLTKVVAGVFTTIQQTAFALAQDVVATVSLSCVGDVLTATFESAAAPGIITTLTAVDSDIPAGGQMGIRSLSSSIRIRNYHAQEL